MNVLTNLLLAGMMSCALIVQASAETYQPNVHYEILTKPVLTKNSSKVEVVDFFWYGCSHCYTFKEKLESWQKNQSDDVYFRGSASGVAS
jgi:thiol:disulfide interchange protein DsbA